MGNKIFLSAKVLGMVWFIFCCTLARGRCQSVKTTTPKSVGFERNVVRRDPSDIIKIGDTHYVYYTKMIRSDETKRAKDLNLRLVYPEGYHGDIAAAKSTDSGHTWQEVGIVIQRGKRGSVDSNSCFTPNILVYKGMYYLYYTAVGDGFDNQSYEYKNRTVLCLAVGKSPLGPFKKLDKPILESTRDHKSFDSFRVDDASLRVVGKEIWLYYKGRSWKNATPNTMMGYAIAANPLGPYVRGNNGKPIQRSGHEVLVWDYKNNVYSYVHRGHGKNSGTFRISKTGMDFDKPYKMVKAPKLEAPGLYRPEICGQPPIPDGKYWGMEMERHGNHSISLKRFALDIETLLSP